MNTKYTRLLLFEKQRAHNLKLDNSSLTRILTLSETEEIKWIECLRMNTDINGIYNGLFTILINIAAKYGEY